MPRIAQALDQSMRHHQPGDLPQADHVYRQILQADPQHVDALHLLGVVAYQVGRSDLAAQYLGEALRLKPDFAEAHYNLGIALQGQTRLEEAVASYRQAT